MIRAYIEQAIRSIEVEKEQALRQVKERVMQEKIVPFNRETDSLRDKAIQQLSVKHNEAVRALQDKFAEDKADILAKSEQHKKEFADKVVAEEATELIAEYDIAIAKLKETLGE